VDQGSSGAVFSQSISGETTVQPGPEPCKFFVTIKTNTRPGFLGYKFLVWNHVRVGIRGTRDPGNDSLKNCQIRRLITALVLLLIPGWVTVISID
jgi:hypothetical protein